MENVLNLKTTSQETEVDNAAPFEMPFFGWYLVLCHILVFGYYMYQSNKITNDGVWNHAKTIDDLRAQDSSVNWHNYVAYLFFVPTDTPSDNPHQVVHDEDEQDSTGYWGIAVFVVLFIVWGLFVYLYFRSYIHKHVFQYTYGTILFLMSIWLLLETIKMNPYF